MRALIARLPDPTNDFYSNEKSKLFLSLCLNETNGDVYAADLEQRKAELKLTLESNAAMRQQLREVEDYICLIVANVRNLKEKADKKEEKQRKKEVCLAFRALDYLLKCARLLQIERAANFSHSINHFFGDETTPAEGSICEDGYAPSQTASVLSQQTLDRITVEAQLVPAVMLGVKSSCLELLKMGVSGETIEQLATSTHVLNENNEMTTTSGQVQDKQRHLQHELAEFVESSALCDSDGHAELLMLLVEASRRHSSLVNGSRGALLVLGHSNREQTAARLRRQLRANRAPQSGSKKGRQRPHESHRNLQQVQRALPRANGRRVSAMQFENIN